MVWGGLVGAKGVKGIFRRSPDDEAAAAATIPKNLFRGNKTPCMCSRVSRGMRRLQKKRKDNGSALISLPPPICQQKTGEHKGEKIVDE